MELSLLADPAAYLAMYEANNLDILDIRPLPPQERDRVRQRHAGEHIAGVGPPLVGANI